MLQFHLLGQHSIVFNDDEDLNDIADRAQRSISMLMGWFKINQVDHEENGIHMPNSQSIMFGIEDPRNGLDDKNGYALVDFLLRILTLGKDTT